MKKKIIAGVIISVAFLAAAWGILYYNGFLDMELSYYNDPIYETEGEWVYSVYDGYAEIDSCRRIAGTALHIPDTLGGYPVKALGWGFVSDSQAKRIREITVPDTLTYFNMLNFVTTAWYENQPDGIVYLGDTVIGIKGELPDGKLLIKEGTRIVAGCAFRGEDSITEVVLPSTLEIISYDAFGDCENLEKINIPDSVTEIGSSAFGNCARLDTIDTTNTTALVYSNALSGSGWMAKQTGDMISFCGTLLFYTKEDSDGEDVFIPDNIGRISDFAFEICENMGIIRIPESCTYISEWAFQDSSFRGFSVDENNEKYVSDDMGNLLSKDKTRLIRYAALNENEEYTVPAQVTYIADEAFSNAKYLKKVSIHENVKYIGIHVFYRACALEEITVSENNENYKSIDGVLFDKAGSKLISYTNGSKNKSYTIPDSVRTVTDWAFNHCEAIEEIVIPDSVTDFGSVLSCKSLNHSGLKSEREEFISEIFLQNCGTDFAGE